MKNMKLISLLLAVVMLFTVSAATANTLEPEDPEIERFAGRTLHATVGEYNEDHQVFTVTVYEADCFEDKKIARLAAGDIVLAGGWLYTVKEMTTNPDGDPMAIMEDGSEIVFFPSYDGDDDDLNARSTDDDRLYMHAIAVLHLPAAEGIIYEDDTDPDLDAKMIVAEGLEEVLKAKAVKEETSIGFDYYATTVTLNRDMEIVKIHQDFDVAQ